MILTNGSITRRPVPHGVDLLSVFRIRTTPIIFIARLVITPVSAKEILTYVRKPGIEVKLGEVTGGKTLTEHIKGQQRGRRLTNVESELVTRQDLYEFDEDLLNEIADYFTGPYEREITVVCESCGKIGTMIEKMPAGCMRLGIPHGYCYDCLKKMIKE